jgi:hypothetical protein
MHKFDDTKDMMVFLEDPDSFLSTYKGENQVPPLSHLHRNNITPPNEADDQQNNYASVEDEMVARAPHALAAFAVDNAALARILKDMVSGFKEATTWARDSFRNRDGRAVMQDLMLHFCGTSRQETVEVTAEAIMNNTFYKGRREAAIHLCDACWHPPRVPQRY